MEQRQHIGGYDRPRRCLYRCIGRRSNNDLFPWCGLCSHLRDNCLPHTNANNRHPSGVPWHEHYFRRPDSGRGMDQYIFFRHSNNRHVFRCGDRGNTGYCDHQLFIRLGNNLRGFHGIYSKPEPVAYIGNDSCMPCYKHHIERCRRRDMEQQQSYNSHHRLDNRHSNRCSNRYCDDNLYIADRMFYHYNRNGQSIAINNTGALIGMYRFVYDSV